jgi:hypothetical protein
MFITTKIGCQIEGGPADDNVKVSATREEFLDLCARVNAARIADSPAPLTAASVSLFEARAIQRW